MSNQMQEKEVAMWKIVRNAATSNSQIVMPREFDEWLEAERKDERERIIDLIVNQEIAPLPAWEIYAGAMIEIIEENS